MGRASLDAPDQPGVSGVVEEADPTEAAEPSTRKTPEYLVPRRARWKPDGRDGPSRSAPLPLGPSGDRCGELVTSLGATDGPVPFKPAQRASERFGVNLERSAEAAEGETPFAFREDFEHAVVDPRLGGVFAVPRRHQRDQAPRRL